MVKLAPEKIMDTTTLIILAVIILFFVAKKMGQVNAQKAIELIREGAVLIDVRTEAEFSGGSVGSAINLPLDQLGEKISTIVTDKQKPILVFCLSGSRSAFAKRVLISAGYTNVHNLGSFWRARTILS